MSVRAPWTDEQVEKLNEAQACGWVHPFTCPTAHPEGRTLVATRDGWRCPHCDYTQDWAHDLMVHGAPPNPIEIIRRRSQSQRTYDGVVGQMIAEAVAAEREACAQIIQSMADELGYICLSEGAAAIRARGETS